MFYFTSVEFIQNKYTISILFSSALLDLAQTFPPNGEPEPGFDFNLYQFAKSQHRRLMVSVLVGRSIGIIVCRVCQTGNMKLVRDIMSVCTDMVFLCFIASFLT